MIHACLSITRHAVNHPHLLLDHQPGLPCAPGSLCSVGAGCWCLWAQLPWECVHSTDWSHIPAMQWDAWSYSGPSHARQRFCTGFAKVCSAMVVWMLPASCRYTCACAAAAHGVCLWWVTYLSHCHTFVGHPPRCGRASGAALLIVFCCFYLC